MYQINQSINVSHVTRCQTFQQNAPNSIFGWRDAPDPTGGAYSAHQPSWWEGATPALSPSESRLSSFGPTASLGLGHPCWLGGSVVERRSLTGELSLVCTGPAADRCTCRSANKANSAFRPFGVDKWVVSCNQMAATTSHGAALWWMFTRWRQHGVICSVTSCVIHAEHFRGELLSMGRYTNLSTFTFTWHRN